MTLVLSGCGNGGFGDYGATGDTTPLAVPGQEQSAAPQDETGAGDAPDTVAKPVGNKTTELVGKTVGRMGNVVTDHKGWILYRFNKDTADPSKSTCVADCAKVWPPVLAGSTLELTGVRASQVSYIKRADGGRQVTVGGWPVYRYIGDKKPGDWNGQSVGKAWYVVNKLGKRNLNCIPDVAPKAAKPPADDTAADNTAADNTAADQSADTGTADSGGY